MAAHAALHLALAMAKTPSLVRTARRSPLPQGMTLLLELAAGDGDALQDAGAATSQSDESLRAAAGFFIEQILLTNNADSYRVLAAGPDAPASKLRRHMALLLKWLHPDVAANNATEEGIDRSLFANRVTDAWEDLKTEERRAAYALKHPPKKLPRRNKLSAAANGKAGGREAKRSLSRHSKSNQMAKPGKDRRRIRRLTIQPLGNEGLISRLVLFFRGHR